MKIWEKYLYKQLLGCFLFFLSCFLLLYALVDFSTHTQDFFFQKKLIVSKVIAYYLHQFLKRLPLLLPLALLVSTIRVLSALQTHRELVALQVCGIRIRKICAPFFYLAFLCSAMSYANEEFLTPATLQLSSTSQKEEKKDPLQKNSKRQFTILVLNDTSKLIYQKIDKDRKNFFDVYWIRSFNDIWKMKYLSTNPETPIGLFVDHITRNEKGNLEKQESFDQILFPSLHWDIHLLNKKQTSVRYQKISELFSSLRETSSKNLSFHAKGEMKTHLAYKLLMPLLPFLVLLGVIPPCIKYSRSFSPFLLYALSLFAFIVFSTGINALVILGENQVFPPFATLLLPFAICFASCGWNFYKKTTQ